MRISLTMASELKLACVSLHQIFETPKGNHFAQCDMNRFRAGFDAQDSRGLIGEMGIESNGGKGASHEISLLSDVYIRT